MKPNVAWWTLGGLVGLDQLLKYLVRHQRVPLVIGRVHIEPFYNYQLLFSWGNQTAVAGAMIVATGLLALVGFIGVLDSRYRLASVLVISGGLSNLADRLLYHFVIDIMRIGTLYLNLADLAVLAGCVVLLVQLCQPAPKLPPGRAELH